MFKSNSISSFFTSAFLEQLNKCKVFSGWLTTTDKELLCFYFFFLNRERGKDKN